MKNQIDKLLIVATSVLVILTTLPNIVSHQPTSVEAAGPGASIAIPSLDVYADIFSMPIVQQNGQPIWYINPWEMRVGHLERTAWLGAQGNIVLAAHETMPDGTPGLFYELASIAVGDEIILSEAGQDYRYIVGEVKVIPYDDISIVTTQANQITLITCAGSYDPAIGDYPLRLAVIASPAQ
jgi:LPXTG-site transpeptidase (sortase) family protein